MTSNTDSHIQITTLASYSLALRRKAWEIILNHLKESGLGHGAYLNLIQNTLFAAQRSGAKLLDYSGSSIFIEALKKDDLFGFLGGTINASTGPKRRISDSKFAVIDAYFQLTGESMWTEFESNENSVVEFLSRFWLPTFSPPRGFTDRPSTVIWTPSRDDLQSLVMNEESAEGLRRSTFTVISLRPRKGSSLFEITYVKAPFVADFFNEDAKIYRKVLAWSGSLDENRLGISVTRGYGCFCEEHVGIFRIASVLRDEVTYEPKSASLKLESSYDGNRVSNFEIFNLFEENARLNFIIFKDQKDFVDQGQKEVLSSFFYRKIYDILDPFQADGNI